MYHSVYHHGHNLIIIPKQTVVDYVEMIGWLGGQRHCCYVIVVTSLLVRRCNGALEYTENSLKKERYCVSNTIHMVCNDIAMRLFQRPVIDSPPVAQHRECSVSQSRFHCPFWNYDQVVAMMMCSVAPLSGRSANYVLYQKKSRAC